MQKHRSMTSDGKIKYKKLEKLNYSRETSTAALEYQDQSEKMIEPEESIEKNKNSSNQ